MLPLEPHQARVGFSGIFYIASKIRSRSGADHSKTFSSIFPKRVAESSQECCRAQARADLDIFLYASGSDKQSVIVLANASISPNGTNRPVFPSTIESWTP